MGLTQIKKAGLDDIALDHVFTIGASGTDHYTFDAEGLNGTVNDPTLYLTRGKTYRFEKGSAHPLRIQSTQGASGTAYNTGVTNNGGTGTVILEVQHDAPDVLYYQCTSHANMNGILYITGALADGGVTTAKLAADAVTAAKIAAGNVTATELGSSSVVEAKIGSNAVTTAKILDSNITTAKIADSNITTAKIADDAVTAAKIADGNVTATQLGSASVVEAKIGTNAVTTTKILDDAVTADKLANSINTEITANTAKTTNATHTGEVTGATALTIADDVVDEANLKVSNSPTNGYFLSAQSGNTGGLTWAQVSTPDSDKIEEGNTSVEAVDTGSDGHVKFTTEGTERARFLPAGQLRLSHGLSGLSGGGVVVMAARSSSGTANQSNYKCDFVVPMGNLGDKYLDVQHEFTSGQTGDEWGDGLGGSGMLIATVQNNYYWGFRTKFYHITTYGDATQTVTRLDQMYNYHTAGHGGNSAAISLAVQSHDSKTPTLRCTFSGDYWNSNVATVTFIGSPVSSYGNIRTQLSTFNSRLTGQNPNWM